MNIFNDIARRYDSDERIEMSHIISEEIKRNLENTKGKTAIDFGCGTGLVGLELIDIFEEVLFIDSSETMIEVVKEKIKANQINTASTFLYDLSVGFPENKADYIIVSRVLLHVPDTVSLLKNLYNSLKEKGVIVIVDFDKANHIVTDRIHNGFEQNYLKEELGKINFKNINSKTFYEGKEILMNQDASMFIMTAQK